MHKKRIRNAIIGAVCTALVIVLAGQGSAAWWGALCNRIALVAVSLQKPEGGAVALSHRVDAAAASAVAAAAPQTTGATVTTTTVTAASTTAATAKTTAAETPAMKTGAVPEKQANAGVVSEQLVSTGSNFVQHVAVRNRSGKSFDLAKELKILPKWKIDPADDRPQVLVVHTHTTEGYLTYDAGFYNPADVERTRDEKRNICAAGEAIVTTLRAAGIAALHDTTVHDSPQYTGAYTRSEATVKAILKKYPSIQVVLDIHRDAILPNDTTRVKPTATINGKKAAQMMIITGVVSTNELPHPNWQENFHFALQLQNALAGKYPDLMRPLYLVASRYNQHLSPGYLLIELGTDVNTVAEAVYSGELLGKTLTEILK